MSTTHHELFGNTLQKTHAWLNELTDELHCTDQHQAYLTLRATLHALRDRLTPREAEQAAKYKEKARVGFGSQIRNYFLHPDQRVKDARTGYSVGNFQSVLDGNIQGFLDSFLQLRGGREGN